MNSLIKAHAIITATKDEYGHVQINLLNCVQASLFRDPTILLSCQTSSDLPQPYNELMSFYDTYSDGLSEDSLQLCVKAASKLRKAVKKRIGDEPVPFYHWAWEIIIAAKCGYVYVGKVNQRWGGVKELERIDLISDMDKAALLARLKDLEQAIKF